MPSVSHAGKTAAPKARSGHSNTGISIAAMLLSPQVHADRNAIMVGIHHGQWIWHEPLHERFDRTGLDAAAMLPAAWARRTGSPFHHTVSA